MVNVILVSIDKIIPNRHQPEHVRDEAKVLEIAESLQRYRSNGTKGLLQAPTARIDQGRYELAFGHHRWYAFQHLAAEDAFFKDMPLIVRDLSDQDMFELMATENFKRRDIGPIEKGKTLQAYMTKFNKTSVETGQVFGMSEEAVRSAIYLLQLPEPAQQKLEKGEINISAARGLVTVNKLLGAEGVNEALKDFAKGEDSPKEVIENSLRSSDDVEDMWHRLRAGKPRAGYDLWELDMKRFPNNLLPELTPVDLAIALGVQDDPRLLKLIDLAYSSEDAAIVHLKDSLKDFPEMVAKVEHLLNPPACTTCLFYAKVDGTHYCGMKTCWSRKKTAWELHRMQNASKKLEIPIYDEAADGNKYALSSYGDRHYWNKGVDLRLTLKESLGGLHVYQNYDGVPDCAIVVLVGKTLEKKKESERTQRSKERNKNADAREKEIAFKRTKSARENLLWEVTLHFQSIFWDVPEEAIDALVLLATRSGRYWMEFEPDGEKENNLRVVTLNVIHYELGSDIMKGDLSKMAAEVEKLAKQWKVKLPKSWMKQVDAVVAETEA